MYIKLFKKTSLLELSALKRVMSEKEEEVRMLITDLNGLQAKYATLVQVGKVVAGVEQGVESILFQE